MRSLKYHETMYMNTQLVNSINMIPQPKDHSIHSLWLRIPLIQLKQCGVQKTNSPDACTFSSWQCWPNLFFHISQMYFKEIHQLKAHASTVQQWGTHSVLGCHSKVQRHICLNLSLVTYMQMEVARVSLLEWWCSNIVSGMESFSQPKNVVPALHMHTLNWIPWVN